MDDEKLNKVLAIRKERLVQKLMFEYINSTLTSDKANGIAGQLYLINSLATKDEIKNKMKINEIMSKID
ncbi:MAG TPA: hypothetical protein ACFYEK_10960 [Candidatus Wunengus sp. YC60]|uniref:hypothetical protein n=1 Tax=Candidatus Wunengus sp. YC60 TaxID=3367697 RepID=UPI004028B7B9